MNDGADVDSGSVSGTDAHASTGAHASTDAQASTGPTPEDSYFKDTFGVDPAAYASPGAGGRPGDGGSLVPPPDEGAGTSAKPSSPAAKPAAPAPKPKTPEHPVLGSAQTTRAAALLKKLPPEDQKKYQDLLDKAKNAEEKQYLTKALASGHKIADITAFQQKIAGKDAKWLQDHLSLTGSSKGTGVQQQWSHSCNATTVEAVKGEMDPIYALKMHEDNPDMGEVDNAKPTADNPNLAADQKAMLESSYQGGVKDAVGYSGKAAARGAPKAGAGRWADDLLNKNSDTTGVSYSTKQIGNGATLDDAVTSIDSNVAEGTPVPIVIGNGTGQYTHYVLVTAADPGPPKTYSIHDPWSGETKIRNESQMKQGKLDIAGSNQITAFEKPTQVPVK